MLAAGAVPNEALEGRQRLVLRYCGCLGRLSRGLGDTAVHPDVAHAQESHAGSAHADPRHSVLGHGHHIWGARVPLRVRENNRPCDPADCVRATVCESRDTAGGTAKGDAE